MYICLFNKDREYRIAHTTVIVLGILTCGTSVLLWYLYKGISGCCNNKRKYSLKGTYVCIYFSVCYFLCVPSILSCDKANRLSIPFVTTAASLCKHVIVNECM